LWYTKRMYNSYRVVLKLSWENYFNLLFTYTVWETDARQQRI